MNALPLFDKLQQPADPPRPAPMEQRRKRIRQAFDAADERFKVAYRDLVLELAGRGDRFTGEDVRKAYLDRKLPVPREWRSTGAIYQSLLREGVLVVVGYRKREQGNMTAIYSGTQSRP